MTEDIEPDEDIDTGHECDRLRIERLDEQTVWIAAKTDGIGKDHHYHLAATEDGLHVTHSTK